MVNKVFWLFILALIILIFGGLFFYKPESVTTVLQVIFALCVVIILLVIAFSVYNMDKINAIRNSGKIRKEVPIFIGMKDLKDGKDETFNTLDKNSASYLDIGNSVNQPGGAEIAYNFWLYIDPSPEDPTVADWAGASKGRSSITTARTVVTSADGGFEDDVNANLDTPIVDKTLNNQIILFMKGSKIPYKYKSICYDENDPSTNYKTDVMIKSPLVKLERGLDVLTIEFNTMESPEGVLANAADTCNEVSTDWEAIHAYKISIKNFVSKYSRQWNMVTIILQDTFPTDPIPVRNKIRCTVYVNGVIELDKYIDSKLGTSTVIGSTIKQNNGNFYINPEIKAGDLIVPDPKNPGAWKAVAKGGSEIITTQPSAHRQVMMADLKYMNYVPKLDEIRAMFNKGFTKKWAPTLASQQADGLDELYYRSEVVPDKAQLLLLNKNYAPTNYAV